MNSSHEMKQEEEEKLEIGILKSKDLGRDTHGVNYAFQNYFGKPHYCLAMTKRKQMEFYDCRSLSVPRCMRTVEEFSGNVTHIIEWSSNLFLAAGMDSKIKSFSSSGFNVQKMFLNNKAPVLRLLKLDDKRFMSVNSEGQILIFNYYSRRIVKELSRQSIGPNVCLVKSKMSENCFFINTQEGNCEVIKLINYETDEVEKEFILKTPKTKVFKIDSFVTFKEILVSINDDRTISFFNCDHRIPPSCKKNFNPDRFLIKQITLSSPITSYEFLKNKYLMVGDQLGLVHLIGLEHDDEDEDNTNNDSFLDILQVPISNAKVDGMLVLSCTQKSTKVAVLSKEKWNQARVTNTWISILEMKNLWLIKNGEKEMARRDLSERSDYVINDIPLQEKCGSFINFRFLNKSIENVFKTFMF